MAGLLIMHDPDHCNIIGANVRRGSLRDPPGGHDHIIFADEFTNSTDFENQCPIVSSPVPKEHYLPPEVKPSPPKFKHNKRRPSSASSNKKSEVSVLLDHASPENKYETKKRGSVGGRDNIGAQCLERTSKVEVIRFSKARVKNAVGSLDNIGPQCLQRTSEPATPKSGRRSVAVGGKDSIGPQCLNRTDTAPPLKLRENKKNQQKQDSIEFCLNRADMPVMRKGRVGGAIGGTTSIGECFQFDA